MDGEAAVQTGEEVELTPEQQEAAAAEAEAQNKAKDDAAAAGGGEGGEEGFDVLEGEDGANAGAGRVVPLSTHIKLKAKLKGKMRNAADDAEAARNEANLLKLQNQQLTEKLAAMQKKPMPKASDYEGKPEEYEKAMREWVSSEATGIVKETLRASAGSPGAAEADDDADDAEIGAYAERAAKLKAADFDQAEDAVIEALGPRVTRQIITLYPNSEAVIYALGKNPKRLGELVAQIKKAPARAIKDLTEYASKLVLKPRGKAPDPDSGTDKTPTAAVISDSQKTLDRMRDQVSNGKRPMKDVLEFKKSCKAKGIKVI